MKEKIIKWYKMGLWTMEMVQQAIDKGFLTIEDLEKEGVTHG